MGIPKPLANLEAGLRSFNRRMPEEINRVLTDHISNLLFCPTESSVANLANEGITKGGDMMYDAALMFGEMAAHQSHILEDLAMSSKAYFLVTVHKAKNTDHPGRLKNILAAFEQLRLPVILPSHPRTRQKVAQLKDVEVSLLKNIRFILTYKT